MEVITKEKTSARLPYLDILNIIAIIAVMFMHHDFGAHYYSYDRSWFFDLVLKITMYFCIPVFLMATGTTLLGYRQKYTTKVYFKKRFLKILVPMVAWFVITGFVRVCLLKDLTIPVDSFENLVSFFMYNKVCDYYWYLFLIIGIYLTIPILSPLSLVSNKRLLRYSIIVLILFNSLLPWCFCVFNLSFNQNLFVQIGTYCVFPLIGYYVSKYNINSRANRFILYGSALVLILSQYVISVVLSLRANSSVLSLLGYTSFPTIVYATAIFVFIRNLNLSILKNERTKKFLMSLASCSFGVYLIHYIVMRFERLLIYSSLGISSTSWVARFIMPLVTYSLCVFVVQLMKRIPIIKKIVP